MNNLENDIGSRMYKRRREIPKENLNPYGQGHTMWNGREVVGGWISMKNQLKSHVVVHIPEKQRYLLIIMLKRLIHRNKQTLKNLNITHRIEQFYIYST
jgi:hypothetical protein